jgi:hypothetical protein
MTDSSIDFMAGVVEEKPSRGVDANENNNQSTVD